MAQTLTIDHAQATQALTDKMCDFLSELRGLGFQVGISEARDAIALAAEGGGLSRPLFQACLKHLLCTNQDQWDQFDYYFLTFFCVESEGTVTNGTPGNNERFEKQFSQEFQIVADFYHGEGGDEEGGAGREQAVTRTDFRFLTEQKGWEEAAKTAERLAKQIKLRPTRRWRKTHNGRKIDLATTARKMARTDGDPLVIGRKQKKRRPLRVLALLDVSHSMAYYSPMLARFVRGLVHHFENSEAFCFHIELNQITDLLKEPDREVMRQRMEAFQNLWFGGTNIAASLSHFNERYLKELACRNTVVLLFSDGCDTSGEAEIVPPIAELRRYVRRLYWINPMQARLQRGGLVSSSPLMAAKSYIDGQISGDSLRSLETLARVMAR